MFILSRGCLPMYADKVDLPYTEAVVMEIQRTANIGPLYVEVIFNVYTR